MQWILAKRYVASLLFHTRPLRKGYFIEFIWIHPGLLLLKSIISATIIFKKPHATQRPIFSDETMMSQKWHVKGESLWTTYYLLRCGPKKLLVEVARTLISQEKNCNYHVACSSSTRVSKLRSHYRPHPKDGEGNVFSLSTPGRGGGTHIP